MGCGEEGKEEDEPGDEGVEDCDEGGRKEEDGDADWGGDALDCDEPAIPGGGWGWWAWGGGWVRGWGESGCVGYW